MESGPEAGRAEERIDDGLAVALFRRPWRFHKGVVALDGLPPADRVEIAFVGRSNVGKSSLINALLDRRGLARTSNTPGRTQEINYFATELPLYIADLPGYGYAKAPRDKVDAWTALVKNYLQGRATLARVYLLVDSRHGLKAVDESYMTLLDTAAVSYQVVLTKVDKLRSSEVGPLVEKTAARLANRPAAYPLVLATSAEKGDGMDALREAIAELCRQRGIVVPA